jgi:outer membrane receptor for ferrienterochelin and colicin
MPLALPRDVRARALTATWLGVLLSAALTLGAPAPARADGLADEAELNFQIGAEYYRAGDFRQALQHFMASNRLVPNRNVVFNIARTFERLSRFADAYRWYTDARVGETDAAVLADIDGALARIAPQVALIAVETTPPGATLYVNRRDLGSVAQSPRRLALSAGTYQILASLDGYVDAASEPTVARIGEEVQVRLTLQPIVGTVHVDADGPTAVYVDDERADAACTAPCDLELHPGAHTLFFRREGFRLVPRQVNVRAHETFVVRAAASAVTGSIVVAADEPDALVEVDGDAVGFTPVVVRAVPVGQRRVRVTLRGYEPIERTIEIREGIQADLRGLQLLAVREVTTASRLPETLEDAPSSLSVITAQELEAFRYPTLAEALRGTRGMSLTFDSAYDSISVRGLGQPNDYGNRLLILQDGAVLNDNILYQSYTGYDGRVDLGDIERIEVVRGPGSVLYGTGAVSGVVNLITHSRDEPTSGWVGLSTYEDSIARARGGFNLDLGRDRGIWTSVAVARSGGRDLAISGVGTATHVNAFDAATLNGRAWWKSVTLQWFLTHRDQRIPTGAFGTRFDDRRTRWKDTRGLLELRFEPRLSARARLFTRLFANHYRFDGDYAYEGAAAAETSFTVEEYRGTWVGGEARVVLEPVDPLRLTLGGEIQASPQATLQGFDAPRPAIGDYYLNASAPFQVYAGYALAEWRPTRAVRLSAGARVDGWSTFGVNVSPRLALVLRPTRSDVLKVMAGRAFRAPSAYEREYGDQGATQVATADVGRALDAESVWSGELEYQRRLTRDWVALASAHVQYASSFIETFDAPADCVSGPCDPDLTDGVTPVYYANGSSDFYTVGGDLEVRRELRGGFMLSANYGYLEARYARTPDTAGSTSTRVPNVPRHYGSARAVIPVTPLAGQLATRLTLEAPRRLGLDDDQETGWALVADLVLSGRVREYGVRWAFGVYNLFDWRYDAPVTDTFASPRMPQQGRSFVATLDATF